MNSFFFFIKQELLAFSLRISSPFVKKQTNKRYNNTLLLSTYGLLLQNTGKIVTKDVHFKNYTLIFKVTAKIYNAPKLAVKANKEGKGVGGREEKCDQQLSIQQQISEPKAQALAWKNLASSYS